MSTQMQLRGGTTAETLLFTGAQREVTVDTDKNTLVVQDGVTAGGFPLATEAQVADGTFYYTDDVGGGSAANAYILVPQPNTNTPNSYQNGIQLGFVTANANTGPSTANFQDLGVKNIKYFGGADPAPGDIAGRVTLIYDATNDWLELQRKDSGVPPQIRTIGGSVSSNALTVSLAPCNIDFRSPSLDNGAVTTGVVTSTISLVVPAGATLGTVNGVTSKIVVVAIYNAGVVELAVVNLAGGAQLDETGLINTTAISAASNSATTFYSLSARTGVPYRVMGFVESTQSAAGTWSSSPSRVQGQGGQTIIKPSTLTVGTAQNTTSGTSIDITGIPVGVKRITVSFVGVSTTGSSPMQIQLGTSGGIETSGYLGAVVTAGTGSGQSAYNGAGFKLSDSHSASAAYQGILNLVLQSGNTWAGTSIISGTTVVTINTSGGSKSLASALDRIRLTTLGGTDTFDAGSINILYEV